MLLRRGRGEIKKWRLFTKVGGTWLREITKVVGTGAYIDIKTPSAGICTHQKDSVRPQWILA